MLQVSPMTVDGKERIQALLTKAAEDIDFRELLMQNPKAALADSDLNAEEVEMLSTMRRVALEEWGVDVRRYRAFLRDNGNKITPV